MKRKVIITGLCLMLAFSITACGTKDDTAKTASAENNSTNAESLENKKEKDNSTEASTEETTVIEVSEEASATTEEDGSITVKTESGEEIKVKPTDKQEKNADGSVTYTTEDGQKVTINESTGSTTVTSEVEVPTSSEVPSGNSGSTETQTSHNHSYKATVTKQPTCTENGEKIYTCSCGSSYKEVISKLGHEEGGWTVVTQPTTTSKGQEATYCTVCGAKLNERDIDKLVETHTHSYSWVEETPATCTQAGKKVYKCSCGDIADTQTITASHNYQWETNGNTRTLKCSGCGATGVTEEYVAGVWGYFDRGAAEELFSYVNSNRAVTQYGVVDAFGNPIGIETVPALTNFDGLYATAKQRAAELATNFSHNLKTDNENIARGCENANACQQAWCYSSSHASTMTNNIYTQGSCAVFYYDADGSGQNLYPYYVLVVNK